MLQSKALHHTHTYTHTYMHTCIHTHIHTYIHAHMHTYTFTCIHTYINTYQDDSLYFQNFGKCFSPKLFSSHTPCTGAVSNPLRNLRMTFMSCICTSLGGKPISLPSNVRLSSFSRCMSSPVSRLYMYVCVYVYTYTYIHGCEIVELFEVHELPCEMCVCVIYMCVVYVYVYVFMHTHTHIHTHTNTRMHANLAVL